MCERNHLKSAAVSTGVCLALACLGCSGKPSRLSPPSIPADAGEQAVSKYDANGNGAIDGDELAKVPALKATLKRVDKDGNGQVTAEEINERVAAWKKSGAGIMRVSVSVMRNGRPLPDAVVKLVPEDFLGSALKAAQATTRADGSAYVEISRNPDESGVQLGYYRIEVTKAGPDGKEQIPARFNTATELGAEIAMDDPNADHLTINLVGN
jgi:hypothetical protein